MRTGVKTEAFLMKTQERERVLLSSFSVRQKNTNLKHTNLP